MEFILDAVKGIFMGIANIIPGVSGGTMAVSLGIYDKFISSISGLTKNFKKSFMALLPIVLGMGVGILGFSFIIEYLLRAHTLVTCLAFIGLIFGGLPVLLKAMKKKMREADSKLGIGNAAAFIILFAVAVGLPMIGVGEETSTVLTANAVSMIILFFVGIIAAATMVIPGVSGSLVLMILGYYYGIINTIKDLINSLLQFNMNAILNDVLVLFPFGIGVLVGIVGVAKLIEYLFNRHSVMTYSAIFGLIIASSIAIFYNTGLYKELSSISAINWVVGIVLCLVCGIITYKLGEKN